ncbi:MAG: cell envelope integrity protein CreD [Deltaproteobacteria bacterium]|nr:cell envelope integrity protein CreD [Deltaproteobacteria bacterium]
MSANAKAMGSVRRVFSPTVSKLILIAILTFLLQVPACHIMSLSQERQYRKSRVEEEIIGKLGGQQQIEGPMISIPYVVRTKTETVSVDPLTNKSEKRVEENIETHQIRVMPEELDIRGTLKTEFRARGIYRVPVYRSDLTLTGWFSPPDTTSLLGPSQAKAITEIQWDKASLSVSVSGLEGLRSHIKGLFNQNEVSLKPEISKRPSADSTPECAARRVSGTTGASVAFDPAAKRLPFKLTLSIEGAKGLRFVPVGLVTTAALSSDWAHPSFDGTFLPQARSITAKGFTADWKVLDLNTNFPASWLDDALFSQLSESGFGVNLAEPVNDSLLFERAAKYCLLFVVLTFFSLFVSELLSKARLHFIQYLLPGLAVVMFYLLLLALSEHVGFNAAYGAAALAVVLLITVYVSGIMRRAALGLVTGGVLAILYGYWFVILQMEDYSLLCGSLGTFALLASVMLGTRKLDWKSLDTRLSNLSQTDPDEPGAHEPDGPVNVP